MAYLSSIVGVPLVIAVMALTGLASKASAGSITITDIAGRTVVIEAPVHRIVLGEGRYLPTLGILDREDPTRRVAGMMGEFEQLDPSTYSQYAARYPAIDDIPRVGRSGAATFSLEKVLSLQPDLIILGAGGGHSPSERHADLLAHMEKAGVPVLFIDFRIDPLVNTPKSLRLLGQAMDREAEAEEFLKFYSHNLERVQKRLDGIQARPSVFLESRVGIHPECCEAMGDQMMGRLLTWAGGRNLFGAAIPGTHGMVSLEHLLTDQPDIYVATAIGSAGTAAALPERVVLGAGVDEDMARKSLARIHQRKGLNQLTSVSENRVFAIWHHFYNTPMHVAAVQAMAKWFHPELFSDLSPEATLEEYFLRFQAVPLNGVYWIGID